MLIVLGSKVNKIFFIISQILSISSFKVFYSWAISSVLSTPVKKKTKIKKFCIKGK